MRRMRSIAALVIVLLLAGCCRDTAQNHSDLKATDEAFSRMSVEKGLNAAFIHYAADSVVKMRDGNFPVIGKKEMARLYLERPDSGMILRWKPVRVDVARSGDLGYTFGDWELCIKNKDTILYGNYISVWKKEPDGSWKYILDSGCNTPKPNSGKPTQ